MSVSPAPGVLPLKSVRLKDKFWIDRQTQFLERGLIHQYEQCEITGRLENFRKVVKGGQDGHVGLYFNDSDVYKWLEAASYALAIDPEWEGRSLVDETISLLSRAQASDGYIDTAFQLGQWDKRWSALTAKHEMYCMGHLIEAGVAHEEARGGSELLEIGRRAAACVSSTFGPNKRKGYCGHQEFELAACRLADATGEQSYRELASWMVNSRGSRPSPFEEEFTTELGRELNSGYVPLVFPEGTYDGTYFQDHLPLEQQEKAVGHAVRAMYFYCGALDSGCSQSTMKSLESIWSNLVSKRMYVTGGIGSAGRNEGFTSDYDLPNREAYAESCAAIGLVFWASRMSRVTGLAKYADVLELCLYNAVLSGVSLDTLGYFYVNPLESRGDHVRKPWFNCACCPPNIARLVLSVQRYCAHTAGGGLTIDVPVAAEFDIAEGTVAVDSQWPWKGTVRIEASAEDVSLKLKVRIPSWCSDARLPAGSLVRNGYLVLEVPSNQTRTFELEFPMTPGLLQADWHVADAIGRVACRRGPLIYCAEEADLGFPVHQAFIDPMAPLETLPSSLVSDGVDIRARGKAVQSQASQLYSSWTPLSSTPQSMRLVPYYAWANRKPGSMAVWLNCTE